jgi:hypothetical protein
VTLTLLFLIARRFIFLLVVSVFVHLVVSRVRVFNCLLCPDDSTVPFAVGVPGEQRGATGSVCNVISFGLCLFLVYVCVSLSC